MMDELGQLFSPQAPAAPAAPDPALKQEWDGFLSNPANKAALLSFGLNLMAPTWGSPAVNAIGAAAETYGGIGAMQKQQADQDTKLSEAAAGRDLQRELNDADNTAAMDRTKYSSDAVTNRVNAKGTAYGRAGQALFNKTFDVEYKRLMTAPDPFTPAGQDWQAPDPAIAAEQAGAIAAQAADAHEARFGGSGATNGGGNPDGAPQTSGISPSAGGQGVGQGAANSPSAALSTKANVDDLLSRASPEDLAFALSDPKGQELLKSKGYDLAEVKRKLDIAKTRGFFLNMIPGVDPSRKTNVTQGPRGPGTGQVK